MHIVLEQVIRQTPEVVFNFVARDFVQNHPRWDPDVTMRQEKEGPIGVGRRLVERRRVFGPWRVTSVFEVTEFRPNERFAFRVVRSPLIGPKDLVGIFNVAQDADGTRLRHELHGRLPALTKIAFRRRLQRDVKINTATIKRCWKPEARRHDAN